jgi:hypothetical protein
MNIAAEGISVVVPEHVPEKSKVSVEFGLPGIEERFLIRAMVARVEENPDGFQLGIRFDSDEGKVLAHVQVFVRDQLANLVLNRQQQAPKEIDLAESPPPRPSKPEERPREVEEYRPTKMTIDLDSSERAGDVAQMFKEAWKKKD